MRRKYDYIPRRRRSRRHVNGSEYLQKAHECERFAATEADPKRKADLQAQAEAYRKLAAKRAKDQGLTLPPELKSQLR